MSMRLHDARAPTLLILVAAVLWHLLASSAPPRAAPPKGTEGRDFASYYYALRAAEAGQSPYNKANLEAIAQEDGTRQTVHPFFYPPPFLLAVVWATPLDLVSAFTVWRWLNELCLLLGAVALWRWWRTLSDTTLPLLAAAIAMMYGVAYTIELGQANFPVLALVLAGLWQQRERSILAGVLLGVACMWKMAPALIVAWWLLRRQWRAVAAACGTAVVLSLLSLPLVGLSEQLRFYTEILPQFGSGDYNGLTIKIEMYANHSIPNVLDQLWPAPGNRLGGTARLLSTLITLGLVGGLGALFYRPTTDPWKLAAQASAVCLAQLLIPVYTYEHHLVFAIPAMVISAAAIHQGRLSIPWAVPVGMSWAALCYETPALRQLAMKVVGGRGPLFLLLQEMKFLALLILLLTTVALGATAWRSAHASPTPTPS